MELVWKKDPIKTLKTLKKNIRGKIMQIAANKAAAPAKAAMVDKVPVDSGALAKSIKIRQRSYRDKLILTSIIGPKASFVKMVKTGKKIKGQKQHRKPRRPSKYYQLLNEGTKYIEAKHITNDVFHQTKRIYADTFCLSVKQQIAVVLRSN